MVLINPEDLIQLIKIRCDDLNDLGLSEYATGLQQALLLVDKVKPVCAVTVDEVVRILNKAKDEIEGKSVEAFADQLMWQIRMEQVEQE